MKQPNIVLILNDDMGYSDIGCYGGEILTPQIDKLAEGGLRFTQFYNTARCSPSRASLLTGLHPHQCGIGVLTDDTGPEGYEDNLNRNCATMAEVLKLGGYRTYMSGKWHMAKELYEPDDAWPNQRGFDEFYGTIPGAGSYYYPKSLIRNNEHIEREAVNNDAFYYTDEISNNAAGFIQKHHQTEGERPFFLYLSYTAPHWPLHARDQDVRRYRGRFDAGWDVLRAERIGRMRSMGIIDPRWALSARDPGQPSWNDATDKEWQARRMEIYAAQITVMDEGIGRVVDALESTGRLDNTVIMFLSDNGGCAEELIFGMMEGKSEPPHYRHETKDGEPVKFGNSPAIEPGPPDTYCSYGVPWANLSNTPFRMYKHWTHEGGIATPFIVSWPEGLRRAPGGLFHGPSQLPDVMATVLDITSVEYPKQLAGHNIIPVEGVSFLPVLKNGEWNRGPLYWEHEGNAAVRDGKWKLVKNFTAATSATPGYDDKKTRGQWELYDMEQDRSEQHDIAAEYPEIVERLSSAYDVWAARCGVRDRQKLLDSGGR